MSTHNYTELRILDDGLEGIDPTWLGATVLQEIRKTGLPVVVFITDDLKNGKPFVTDNDTNVNRRGKGQ